MKLKIFYMLRAKLHISQNTTPAAEFACCRHLTPPWQFDSQKHATRHVWSAAPATKLTMEVSKVLPVPRKMQLIFWKRCESIAPTAQNDFRHVIKHVGMSQRATPATQNEAKRHLDTFGTSRSDPFCRTRRRHGHSDLVRTVENGCGRLRTHPQPPDPQSETGTLATHSGKHRLLQQCWLRRNKEGWWGWGAHELI